MIGYLPGSYAEKLQQNLHIEPLYKLAQSVCNSYMNEMIAFVEGKLLPNVNNYTGQTRPPDVFFMERIERHFEPGIDLHEFRKKLIDLHTNYISTDTWQTGLKFHSNVGVESAILHYMCDECQEELQAIFDDYNGYGKPKRIKYRKMDDPWEAAW